MDKNKNNPPESGVCDFCGEESIIVDVLMDRVMAGICICEKSARLTPNKKK